MEPFPQRCVADASVLIDLNEGHVLPLLFQLPLKVIVPDVIVSEELLSIDVETVKSWGLSIRPLSPSQVMEVYFMAQKYRRVSVNDLFAFVLARDIGAFLLTGDNALRKFAERKGITVHGTLWVLESLVALNYLKPVNALAALKRMLSAGSRFPQHEIERLREMWL